MEFPGVSCVRSAADDFVYVTGDATEIATVNAGVDVVGRLDVSLVGIGGHAFARESRDVA